MYERLWQILGKINANKQNKMLKIKANGQC